MLARDARVSGDAAGGVARCLLRPVMRVNTQEGEMAAAQSTSEQTVLAGVSSDDVAAAASGPSVRPEADEDGERIDRAVTWKDHVQAEPDSQI